MDACSADTLYVFSIVNCLANTRYFIVGGTQLRDAHTAVEIYVFRFIFHEQAIFDLSVHSVPKK